MTPSTEPLVRSCASAAAASLQSLPSLDSSASAPTLSHPPCSSALAQELLTDTSPLALRPPSYAAFYQMCAVVENTSLAHKPASTLAKEKYSMKLFIEFCAQYNTPAWRTERWTDGDLVFRRESVLLSYFLIWLTFRISARAKRDKAPKPKSCYNIVLAVRRAHADRGYPMVPSSQVGLVLRSLCDAYAREHGPEALLPRRKEPFEPRRNAEFRALKPGTRLGSRSLAWDTPFFVTLWAVLTVAGSTGFRKAEVAVPSGQQFSNMHLSRDHLQWLIGGSLVPCPSLLQLQTLKLGDYALIRPPPSKTDPFGTIFGNQFVYLPFVPDDPVNAAVALRELELTFPVDARVRRQTPLFATDTLTLSALSHGVLDGVLGHLFRCVMPVERACNYSFHSFRIGLACALMAAGCSDSVIQAHCRWRTADSVRIYARPNPEQFGNRILDACTRSASSLVVANAAQLHMDGDASACAAAAMAGLALQDS